jgi:lipoprotein signal peptidase
MVAKTVGKFAGYLNEFIGNTNMSDPETQNGWNVIGTHNQGYAFTVLAVTTKSCSPNRAKYDGIAWQPFFLTCLLVITFTNTKKSRSPNHGTHVLSRVL